MPLRPAPEAPTPAVDEEQPLEAPVAEPPANTEEAPPVLAPTPSTPLAPATPLEAPPEPVAPASEELPLPAPDSTPDAEPESPIAPSPVAEEEVRYFCTVLFWGSTAPKMCILTPCRAHLVMHEPGALVGGDAVDSRNERRWNWIAFRRLPSLVPSCDVRPLHFSVHVVCQAPVESPVQAPVAAPVATPPVEEVASPVEIPANAPIEATPTGKGKWE